MIRITIRALPAHAGARRGQTRGDPVGAELGHTPFTPRSRRNPWPNTQLGADYIVIGAGSAGSVIARRLLDAGHTVHVLEAGSTDTDPNIHSPQGWPLLLTGANDWAVMTTPQRHANNRSPVLATRQGPGRQQLPQRHDLHPRPPVRLRCVGSQRRGGLVLGRGAAAVQDGPRTTQTAPREFHGQGGPLHVERIGHRHPAAQAFVDAAKALGHHETEDFNGSRMTGVGFNHTTTRGGKRASAWQSFMAPVLDHPGLTVTTGGFGDPDRGGRRAGRRPSTTRWGAWRTGRWQAPKSSFPPVPLGPRNCCCCPASGPQSQLAELGIATVADLPGVGENLHDHLLAGNIYEASEPLAAGRHNLLESQLYTHSNQTDEEAPDLQPLFLHLPYPTDGGAAPEHGYTIAPGIVRPRSRGSLRLASSDPAAAPLVDPNILADEYDVEALVDAVEICREIGRQDAFTPFRKSEHTPQAVTGRDSLRQFVRQVAGTYHHQVGTCKMGVDDLSVVDPQLRVHGITGLRVADASIIPSVPSGNTNAPAIMIGEKAADLLLAAAAADSAGARQGVLVDAD